MTEWRDHNHERGPIMVPRYVYLQWYAMVYLAVMDRVLELIGLPTRTTCTTDTTDIGACSQ